MLLELELRSSSKIPGQLYRVILWHYTKFSFVLTTPQSLPSCSSHVSFSFPAVDSDTSSGISLSQAYDETAISYTAMPRIEPITQRLI